MNPDDMQPPPPPKRELKRKLSLKSALSGNTPEGAPPQKPLMRTSDELPSVQSVAQQDMEAHLLELQADLINQETRLKQKEKQLEARERELNEKEALLRARQQMLDAAR